MGYSIFISLASKIKQFNALIATKSAITRQGGTILLNYSFVLKKHWLLLIFLSREAVFRGSGVQGMYQLLPGFLQPGANVHRQQAGMSGWMLLSRW